MRSQCFLKFSTWFDAPLFARFAIVGVTCALLNNALLICFVMLGLMPIGAALATVPPSLMIGYALQAGFVFRERPTWAAFLRYCIAMLSNQPISLALIYVFCHILRLPIYIAGPAMTAMLSLWNLIATRWAIESEGSSPEAPRLPEVER
ncbi:GtrA family protein [Methylocystis sp. JR02]|uniref:GtrA family protein n=1 Tax=Methylocystis sp. JR02 TaxID=3046284 RepID=UPI0024BA3B9E|nr:GtrA family protein [Methylocystis sp. JR02]MDJ0450430.1 GtrA family protein [Methylocystis sp. JR02]